ncbi:MAG: hypothetical protein IIA59_02745 [Candidatus Marinimicrobia bacterium]|nr:hypothetical protein [Candidatus Neomarinimicrobiota bacterium]
MTKNSHLLLWTFAGSAGMWLLAMQVFDPRVTGINPMILADIQTGLIVFGISFGLFIGAFPQASWDDRPLLQARIGWLLETVVISGVLGTVMGMYSLGRGVSYEMGGGDIATIIGSGLAMAFLSIIYMALLVAVLFGIKQSIVKATTIATRPAFPTRPPSRIRPVVGLLMATLIGVLTLFMQAVGIGVPLLLPLISIRTAGMVVLSLAVALFIFGGRPLADTLLLPFLGIDGRKTSADKMLVIVRGYQRIVALLGLIIAMLIPLMSLKGMGAGKEATFIPLVLGLAYIMVVFAVFLYCMLIEGLLIQHAYHHGRQLPLGDRGFIFKAVIPMFLIIFMTFMFDVIALIIL